MAARSQLLVESIEFDHSHLVIETVHPGLLLQTQKLLLSGLSGLRGTVTQRPCCRELWWCCGSSMLTRCTAFRLTNFPVSDIIHKLGGEGYFKFLCRLDQAPERAREHNRDHVATYDRVLLELSAGEARSVRMRSGFYEVQDSSSKAVSKILGEPNVATEVGGSESNKQQEP